MAVQDKTYVVVYDEGSDENCATENYYGYFSSIEDARRMFNSLRGNSRRFFNIKICLVMENM